MRTRVLLVTILLLALVFCAIYFAQDLAVFQANRDPASWEALAALPAYETVEVSSGRKTWHGMLRHAQGDAPSPLILLFVASGQNAAGVMRGMEESGLWPCFGDYSCLVVDYAGYGPNGGRPSAKNMCEQALAAFDYASALPGVSRVIAGGYSIGTGPATYLAAHREVAGLFLLAPFANSYDLYNGVLPVFYGPMRLFVRHRFASDTYAGSIRVPSLVVASRDDEIVPFASSEALHNRLGEASTLVPLDGVGHGWILFNRTALDSIRTYLDMLEGNRS